MDVRAEISYPGAAVGDVFALALDPTFRGAVCKATLAIEHDIAVREEGDGSTVVRVSRTIAADFPDFVRRMVGNTIELVQTETWAPDDASGRRRAGLSLQVVGQPASMTGTIVLEPDAGGVREVIQGDLRVTVPFINKRIESEIAKGIMVAARKEQETGRSWLAPDAERS